MINLEKRKMTFEEWKSYNISMGKIAYCFTCEKFLTNMQDIDTCPDCTGKELVFST